MCIKDRDNRIEVLTPILDNKIYQRIRQLIDFQLNDTVKARKIDKNQKNQYLSRKGKYTNSSQHKIFDLLSESNAE